MEDVQFGDKWSCLKTLTTLQEQTNTPLSQPVPLPRMPEVPFRPGNKVDRTVMHLTGIASSPPMAQNHKYSLVPQVSTSRLQEKPSPASNRFHPYTHPSDKLTQLRMRLNLNHLMDSVPPEGGIRPQTREGPQRNRNNLHQNL